MFEVADNGIGIAQEMLDEVRKIFAQDRTTVETAHAGVGLGLPIAIKLLEAHGAKLDIDSELGRGTTVTVLFPAGYAM